VQLMWFKEVQSAREQRKTRNCRMSIMRQAHINLVVV
jgi:hypothetical protein